MIDSDFSTLYVRTSTVFRTFMF